MATKRLKENNDLMTKQEQEEQKIKFILKIHDFMEKWQKEEECFRNAVIYDFYSKKYDESGWPRNKPVDQIVYEKWLTNVVNPANGEFYPQKDREGIAIKGTGARYIVTVITRIRDAKGKNEYLYSKGRLEGFNASGRPEKLHISWPEVWMKTEFAYERNYNEKTGSFTEYTTGPSGTYEMYDLPFNPENVKKLFAQTEDDEVLFMLKDLKTQEARNVQWSSVKDTLDLFCNKPFSYLWNADYMPAPLKADLRAEAVARGLIGGTASDFNISSGKPSYTS